MEELLDFFTTNFDTAIISAANGLHDALAGAAAPLLALLIAAGLAVYMLSSAFRGSFSLESLLHFYLRSIVIYSLVAGGVLWSGYVQPFLSGFGEGVGATLYQGMTGETLDQDGLIDALVAFLGTILAHAGALFNLVEGGWVGINGAVLLSVIMVLTVSFTSLGLLAVAFGLLVIAKVTLALLMGLAPIFLVWMYFGATQSIAQGWFRSIISTLVTQILVYAVLGLVLSVAAKMDAEVIRDVVDTARTNAGGDDGKNAAILDAMLQLTFISLLGLVLLFSVPGIASRLGGGGVVLGGAFAGKAGAAASGGARSAGAATYRGAAGMMTRADADPLGAASNARGAAEEAANPNAYLDQKYGPPPTPEERALKLVRQMGNK